MYFLKQLHNILLTGDILKINTFSSVLMSLLSLVVKNYFLFAAKSEFITTLTEKAKQVFYALQTLFYFHGYMAEFTDKNILLKSKALCKFFGSQKISHVNAKVLSFIYYIK